MRILVTGASGFVGRHAISALLSQGHSVVGVSRKVDRSVCDEWISADLLQSQEPDRVVRASKPDAILHAAWVISDREHHWSHPENFRWVEASTELMRAGIDAGVKRVCAIGTCFEYAWPDSEDCDEANTPLFDHIPYSACKNASNRKMSELASAAGISFAWARLFHLFGPHERSSRLVGSIASALAKGEVAPCSKGDGLRDFMDVREAGRALSALTTSSVNGDVNVATGIATKISDIAKNLGAISGRPHLVGIGLLPSRSNDPPRITAATKRLTDEVGFKPINSLEDGLRDAFYFWRDEIRKEK